MARTALLNKLIAITRLAHEAGELEFDAALARRTNRRSFLKQAGAAAALGVLPLAAQAVTYKSARIAIVGAGLAGLRCAYELKKAGIDATVYEGNPARIGGRCWTNRSSFGQSVTENGGELIDTAHTNVRRLAGELGLQLDDLNAWTDALGLEELYHINGHAYTAAQAFNDFKGVAKQLNQDVAHAPFPQTWNNYTQRGWELDHMSVADYIERYVPGGLASDFGSVLAVAYNIEYGAEPAAQSAYGLVCLLGYSNTTTNGTAKFYWFGTSDERFHIRGGNDQLVTRMAATLGASQIVMGRELRKIALNGDATYSLTFKTAAGTSVVIADHVVIAIPFSILRYSVDLSAARFDGRKLMAITTMPMGSNCKFQLQFNRRVWHDYKCNGETYSDLGFQNTWEPTRAQAGKAAVINNFTGGDTALAYANAKDINALASSFLAQWEKLVPGCSAQWTGKAVLNNWPKEKWTRGAYGYYAPGNFTSFVGYEGVRQFNCHFCGEHTSVLAQGYLEGAVETGQRCAAEIMADLKNA